MCVERRVSLWREAVKEAGKGRRVLCPLSRDTGLHWLDARRLEGSPRVFRDEVPRRLRKARSRDLRH
eukprot:3971433-Pleurochrysis_carterae.AAC.2